ncbi:hypothetical protein A3770_05p40580 [Chloropicon primus]|uniref:Uncharacterized protein n=1 Tax=Chloropicon primus TaxID=1764295 RepID=A0A5B8MQ74_9CHLO|nr:hypothetical protein A3770_05p40580 [Chloropicon primus]|mmetsp:Transcript_3065/g.8366  ORF Transcript_3065/g.8366 Transcript_3065/m.8366 type:complete len:218 (+) Transcript_3065:822-1475(+)|eukprot:QDZ21540.1 hypothetical protein A3770_05p40580 [Chloropicon primus]
MKTRSSSAFFSVGLVALLVSLVLGGARCSKTGRSLQVFNLASFGIPTDFDLNPLSQVNAQAVLPSSVPSVVEDIVPLRVPLRGIRNTFTRFFEGGDSGNGVNSAINAVNAEQPPVNSTVGTDGYGTVPQATMGIPLNATEEESLMEALTGAEAGLQENMAMYTTLNETTKDEGFNELITGINGGNAPNPPLMSPSEAFGIFQNIGFSVLGSFFGVGG